MVHGRGDPRQWALRISGCISSLWPRRTPLLRFSDHDGRGSLRRAPYHLTGKDIDHLGPRSLGADHLLPNRGALGSEARGASAPSKPLLLSQPHACATPPGLTARHIY